MNGCQGHVVDFINGVNAYLWLCDMLLCLLVNVFKSDVTRPVKIGFFCFFFPSDIAMQIMQFYKSWNTYLGKPVA